MITLSLAHEHRDGLPHPLDLPPREGPLVPPPADGGKSSSTVVAPVENDVIFGSVNANRPHYRAAAEALAQADLGWLGRIITRRVPLDKWPDALERRRDDVKTVINFTEKIPSSGFGE
jgi:hypothetical protein